MPFLQQGMYPVPVPYPHWPFFQQPTCSYPPLQNVRKPETVSKYTQTTEQPTTTQVSFKKHVKVTSVKVGSNYRLDTNPRINDPGYVDYLRKDRKDLQRQISYWKRTATDLRRQKKVRSRPARNKNQSKGTIPLSFFCTSYIFPQVKQFLSIYSGLSDLAQTSSTGIKAEQVEHQLLLNCQQQLFTKNSTKASQKKTKRLKRKRKRARKAKQKTNGKKSTSQPKGNGVTKLQVKQEAL